MGFINNFALRSTSNFMIGRPFIPSLNLEGNSEEIFISCAYVYISMIFYLGRIPFGWNLVGCNAVGVEFRVGGILYGWNLVWVESYGWNPVWVEFRVGGIQCGCSPVGWNPIGWNFMGGISWVETRGWNPMGGISLGGIPRGWNSAGCNSMGGIPRGWNTTVTEKYIHLIR